MLVGVWRQLCYAYRTYPESVPMQLLASITTASEVVKYESVQHSSGEGRAQRGCFRFPASKPRKNVKPESPAKPPTAPSSPSPPPDLPPRALVSGRAALPGQATERQSQTKEADAAYFLHLLLHRHVAVLVVTSVSTRPTVSKTIDTVFARRRFAPHAHKQGDDGT